MQEKPRNHLDLRNRLNSKGQREGKVIDYRYANQHDHFSAQSSRATFMCVTTLLSFDVSTLLLCSSIVEHICFYFSIAVQE